jgi:Spy/CpxP family protein refolding chaperone
MKINGLRLAVVTAALVLLMTQFVGAAETKGRDAHEQASTASATAPAAAPGVWRGGMKMGMMGRMSEMIPADKKEAFDAIEAKYAPLADKAHQDVYAKNAELSGALAANPVDEAKVKALGKELGALYAKLSDLETEMRLEMRKQGIPFGPYMQPRHGRMGGGAMQGKMGGHGAMMGGHGGRMGGPGGMTPGCPMMQTMQHGQPAAPAEDAKK